MRHTLAIFLIAVVIFPQAFAQTPNRPSVATAAIEPSTDARKAPADRLATDRAMTDKVMAEKVIEDKVIDLGTVVVTGAQPGPGLWKVSKGEHTLWILGTQSPLPRQMEWDSANVQRVIAEAQEVLGPNGIAVNTNQGMFRTLLLVPSLLKARKNPDGKTLQELLPPTQYARWQTLKQRYIGRDRGIEKWRPVFAALELYNKAIERSGMTQSGVVQPVVSEAMKQRKIKATNTAITVTIDNPKAAIKAFSAESLDDLDCFNRTLDRIEGDLGTMIARANAWAVGDIEALRTIPYRNQFTACSAAFAEADIARKLGYQDLDKRMERSWLAAAEAALAKNASTFATLPVSQLLQPGALLAQLREKGYEVQEP